MYFFIKPSVLWTIMTFLPIKWKRNFLTEKKKSLCSVKIWLLINESELSDAH